MRRPWLLRQLRVHIGWHASGTKHALEQNSQFRAGAASLASSYDESSSVGTEDRDKRYIDRLKVSLRAGSGGNGWVSFWRSGAKGKHAPADGGNGGSGGNVIVQASANMKSLAGVQQLYKAEAGTHGSKQKQHGRGGRDTVVLVPVGTVVSRLRPPSGEADNIREAHSGAVAGRADPDEGQVRCKDNSRSSGNCGDGGTDGSSRMATMGLWEPNGDGLGAGADLAGSGPPPRGRGRKRPRPGGLAKLGPPPADGEEEFRPAREDEIPDWFQRWRRPWVGARDYRSDEEEEEEEEGKMERLVDGAREGARHPAEASSGSSGSLGRDSSPAAEMVADLVEDGQQVIVARGGKGGRGNAAFRSRPNRPAPKDSEKGEAGERVQVLLELKLLAEVGLVGLPNAGKSTLLRAISNATPRVGSYAFTTLAPQLGMVEFDDGSRIVVADIPGKMCCVQPVVRSAVAPVVVLVAWVAGLIEGASANRGLGHHFLRHIERTKALAYVVDASAGISGSTGIKPWDALDLLQHEIQAYAEKLDRLPALVVANKIDLLPRPASVLRSIQQRTDLPVGDWGALGRPKKNGTAEALTG
ncbi:hypothetical protein N2152v2_000993 [Parachlorella kessleri]